MKKILMALGILIGLILLIGLALPKDFHIEREVVINKPKSVVFDYMKQLKKQDNWSPWAKMDPGMSKSYKGEDGTVGFTSSWSGNNKVGEGEQEIKNIVEGERIDTELRFKKPMANTNTAYFITESVGPHQTKVRWGMNGKSPYPFNIVCFIFNMKKKVGENFEEGLESLKAVLEKQEHSH